MNLALLEVLRARRGEWCSVESLADHLFASPANIQTDVANLRSAGYLIEIGDGPRFRFLGVADKLIPHEITRSLATRRVGRNVVCLDEADSTNDELWQLFRQGAREGTVVLAESQRHGRGRFGRSWLCPHGSGLLLSVLLQPDIEPARSSVLTIMGAVAVTETLNEHLHVPALIKWPNDIMARGQKLGGLLVEARKEAGRGRGFVLGIGLNVNVTTADMPAPVRSSAASLRILTGDRVDRIELLRALLRAMDRWYDELLQGRYGLIAQQWRRYSSTLGARVTVEENGRRYTGRVLDISLEAGIILGMDRGGTRSFSPAEATVVSP